MYDGIKVKVTSPSKLDIRPFSKTFFAIYNGKRQLTTYCLTGTMSIFDRAGFLIFVLVSVSRDFELGRNVSPVQS